jgi:transposase-like protein
MKREPKTLMEAIRYFGDPDVAFEAAKEFRFPNGVHCPTCGREDVRFIATRRMWECKEKHPRKQFSVKVGSIMEDSPLGLDIWFAAIWTIANDKNGISSYEFAKLAGITQKSAWHVMHRVRLAMKVAGATGGGGKLDGTVEIDETLVGGKARNMHKTKRERVEKLHGSYNRAKVMVGGVLKRASDQALSHVRVGVLPGSTSTVGTVLPFIRANVENGSEIMADSLGAYTGLRADYTLETVNHAAEEYVRGRVHNNGMENFWSLLKRTLGGTYVSVEPFHLSRYLDEQAFRFNERKGTDGDRFRKLASCITGLRLTWKELTGYEDAGEAA